MRVTYQDLGSNVKYLQILKVGNLLPVWLMSSSFFGILL
jgi:hypothetical protein